jgi:flagellar hook-associated protein 2
MPVRLTGLVSGMDTESLIKEIVNAQKLKNKRVEDKKTLLEWKQERWKELNAKLYKLYTTELNKMTLKGNYQTKKATSSNENLATVTSVSTAPEGSHTLVINSLAKAQFVTGGKITADKDGNPIKVTAKTRLTELGIEEGTTISIGKAGKQKKLTVTADTTIEKLVNTAKSAGLNASFDAGQRRLFLSSKESGISNSFGISAVDINGEDANDVLSRIGLDALNSDGTKTVPGSSASTVVEAADSSVIYNGALLTSSSNVISVNGLTITLKGADENQTVSLNVSKDTQAVYDMVKKFITAYNEVLKEMNDLYYAPSARGYDPLTDEQREAMTEEQIAKWEAKIKDSILRRDSTLGSLLDTMKVSLMAQVEYGGKKYSLASFGIQTSEDYMEKGLLHIYGDSDDSQFAAYENKLMKALEEDPDAVAEILSGISKKLYDAMNDKMRSIPNVRSALTFYNDKIMIDQQKQYEKQVKELEYKLIDLENKYYRQFSEMEKAMSRMQSQNNSLLAMLGMNTQ